MNNRVIRGNVQDKMKVQNACGEKTQNEWLVLEVEMQKRVEPMFFLFFFGFFCSKHKKVLVVIFLE